MAGEGMTCVVESNNHSGVTNVYVQSTNVEIRGENVQVISGDHSTGAMYVNNFDSYHGHEHLLMKSFQEMKEVFVETQPYLIARKLLLESHFIILIGTSGAGKSFIAKKLIHEKVREGYQFKEIKSGQDLRTLCECKNTIFLLDDAFQADNPNTQFLIAEMEEFNDANNLNDNSNYMIITSRTHPFSVVKKKMGMSWLLDGECIVDLQKTELSKQEKREIIKKHIKRFKPQEIDKPEMKNMIEEIVNVHCIGFPNYAYLFVRNGKWFRKGVAFFRNSVEIIQREIDNLAQSDPNIYLFLVYLLLKGGQITGSSIDSCENDENVIQQLEKIKKYKRKEYCTVLNKALHDIEYAYVSRVSSTGTITFRHDRIVEAVCLSFSKILPREALKSVPFDFIAKRVRTGAYETDLQDMIIITRDRYKDLAERFEYELKLGNVKAVCEHPTTNDQEFVNMFIKRLCNDTLFLIQISERAYGSTIDGSLLYWSASSGAEILCKQILEQGFYSKVKDKFWVRTQSSAALVPSCWYGFVFDIIEKLLELGADINSSIHSSRCFQTHTSNFLVVHEPKGWTPIQAAICGSNNNKSIYVEKLIENVCQFQEKERMVRPLIHAVKQEDKQLVNLLLKRGVNVHAVDMWEKSAIQFAVELDVIEITKLLLREMKRPLDFVQPRSIEMIHLLKSSGYFEITKKDSAGKSLLHCAEDPELVVHLLEVNQDLSVNMRDRNGRTPLYYAKTDDVIQCLIKHGAFLSCVDERTQDTFFHVQHNPLLVENALTTLTKEHKTKLLNMKNKSGVTPIFTSTKTFSLLLENGADVNIKCSYSQEKELTEESKTSDRKKQLKNEIVLSYIERLRTPSPACDNSNTTTMSSEYTSEDIENIEDSENQCENLDIYFTTDITVVMKLISKGQLSLDLLELALKYGYDFSIQDRNGQNILHHFLSSNVHTKGINIIIDKLLQYAKRNLTKAEFSNFLNHRDIQGKTALYLACCCSKENKLKTERYQIVVTMLELGGDPSISNNNNEKPANRLMKCRCCLKSAILRKLVTHGKMHESDTGYTIVIGLLQSCSALENKGTMTEDILKDSVDIIKYVISTYPNVSLVRIIKYVVDHDTDPNIPFLILRDHIDILDDYNIDKIMGICTETHNANSVICRLTLQHHMHLQQQKSEIHISTEHLPELFKFFVGKLQKEALRIILNTLCDNADIYLLKEDLVVWTIFNAPECLKSYLLNFLLERDVIFCKLSAINHCIDSSDEEIVTIECLKSLLMYGATLRTGCPLIKSLKSEIKRPKVISFLLKQKEIDLNQQDETKQSVFYCFLEHFAKNVHENDALPIFKDLLTQAKTNNGEGVNLLTLALKCKKLSESFIIEIIERLRDTSCINQVDSSGRTPLQNVLLYYYYDKENPELNIVKQIVRFGGTTITEQKDASGQNCLHILVSRMKIDTLKILLYIIEKDKDNVIETINAKDNDGNSVLHHACMVSTSDHYLHTSLRISIVRILLVKGAEINAINMNNQTVLHLLIQRCSNMSQQDKDTLLNPIIELINLLLEHGIDESIVDKDGKIAIQYLTDESIGIRKLMEKNAKPEDLIVLPDSKAFG